VIHVSSGTAGFVGAAWIGPRLLKFREDFQPNNMLMVLVGAGILWIGWNGFNGGDPYAASARCGSGSPQYQRLQRCELANMDTPRCSLLQETSSYWCSPRHHHRTRCNNTCCWWDRLLGRYLHGHPFGKHPMGIDEYHQ